MRRDARLALAQTIASYEKALAMLRMGILPSLVQSEWIGYGTWNSCRICRALRAWQMAGMHPDCTICPIGDGKTRGACSLALTPGFYGPADRVAEVNRSGQTFGALKTALKANPLDVDAMIAAFQARLDWILETAEKNGHQVQGRAEP